MNKILLFIPCYNCEKQILRVLNSLNNEVFNFINEIVLVDNRSEDNTRKVIHEFLKENKKKNYFKLFLNDENYSFGGSHKVVINYAKEKNFSHILVLHGDDQANINDILLQDVKDNLNLDCFIISTTFISKADLWYPYPTHIACSIRYEIYEEIVIL